MSRRARELDALNLGQGFPDYDIDPRLTELVAEAMRGGHNQYAPMEGVLALRERIAAKLLRVYGRAIDPESEITVTLGATEAIFSAIQAAVGAGDEVIAFDPAYDSYEPAVRLSGARCLRLPLVQPGFRYDWERVRAALNARTRLILFNSPLNPACTTAQSAALEALAELIDGRDVAVLSDEVYEHVVFDGGQHHSVLTHPALAPGSSARCTSATPSASPIRCNTPSRPTSPSSRTVVRDSRPSSRRSAIGCAGPWPVRASGFPRRRGPTSSCSISAPLRAPTTSSSP